MKIELGGHKYQWDGGVFRKAGIGDLGELNTALLRVYADLQALYLMAQGAHWNVSGPGFYEAHLLFQRVYEALGQEIDRIAEHLRFLGFVVPVDYRNLSILTGVQIPEVGTMTWSDWNVSSSQGALLQGHFVLEESLKAALAIAQATTSEGTANLLGDAVESCGQRIYLIRSNLQ